MEILYEEQLRNLLDARRFRHSVATAGAAVCLAETFGADPKQAWLAGLLHDCARNFSPEQLRAEAQRLPQPPGAWELKLPVLLHAPVGAAYAQQRFQVTQRDTLRAIARHTLGAEQMTTLDKIIYVADKIEPGRKFPGVEDLRALARVDLDRALLGCFDSAIGYALQRGSFIHPTTVAARNILLSSLV